MKKLSPAQEHMLHLLQHDFHSLDSFGMLMYFGKAWKQTFKVLERRGLVRFFPYAKNGYHYRAVKP